MSELEEYLELKEKIKLLDNAIEEIDLLSEVKNRSLMHCINDTVKRTKNSDCIFQPYLEYDPKRESLVKERNDLSLRLNKLKIIARFNSDGNQKVCTGSYVEFRSGAKEFLIHITKDHLAFPDIHHYSNESEVAKALFGKTEKESVRLHLSDGDVYNGFIYRIKRRDDECIIDDDYYKREVVVGSKVKIEFEGGKIRAFEILKDGIHDSKAGKYLFNSAAGRLLLKRKLYDKIPFSNGISAHCYGVVVEIE